MCIPFIFSSKFLRLSRLYNLDISSIIPCLSSSLEKGTPKTWANLFNWQMMSFFKSSYFRNNTFSGLSLLILQYPNTWSQYGPHSSIPLHTISRPASSESGCRGSGRLWFTKCHSEMNLSTGFQHIYTIRHLESLMDVSNISYGRWVARNLGRGRSWRLGYSSFM